MTTLIKPQYVGICFESNLIMSHHNEVLFDATHLYNIELSYHLHLLIQAIFKALIVIFAMTFPDLFEPKDLRPKRIRNQVKF